MDVVGLGIYLSSEFDITACSSLIVLALFWLVLQLRLERSSLCWVSLALRLAESLRENKPGRIPSADEAVSGWVPAQAAAL